VSSLEFLSKHGFSLDACIAKGIPYLSLADEKAAREYRCVVASPPRAPAAALCCVGLLYVLPLISHVVGVVGVPASCWWWQW
jgi:hypothetical protein